jgi:hypothetical protein
MSKDFASQEDWKGLVTEGAEKAIMSVKEPEECQMSEVGL